MFFFRSFFLYLTAVFCPYGLQISVYTVVCISVEKCLQFFSMGWQTFRALQHPWQSGTSKILIGGCQKLKHDLVPQGAPKLQDANFQVFTSNFDIL